MNGKRPLGSIEPILTSKRLPGRHERLILSVFLSGWDEGFLGARDWDDWVDQRVPATA